MFLFIIDILNVIFCVGIIKNAGPGITEAVNKSLDEEEAMYKNIRQKEIDQLKGSISLETTAQVKTISFLMISII